MPVKKDASGRRSVEAEVEVPGTPEEVWQAIATGPGISSWFVPTTLEERVGGSVVANFGPGMESLSTITAWDPPHRFVADSRDDMGPDGPTIATEWIVEARSGGTCIVRVVHSWFTSSDDWDDQFEGHTATVGSPSSASCGSISPTSAASPAPHSRSWVSPRSRSLRPGGR